MNAIAPGLAAPRPTLKTWLLAFRPKTTDGGAGAGDGGHGARSWDWGVGRWLPALAALLGAMLIQVATNLTNDYYDFKKGAGHGRAAGTQARDAERVDRSAHGAA